MRRRNRPAARPFVNRGLLHMHIVGLEERHERRRLGPVGFQEGARVEARAVFGIGHIVFITDKLYERKSPTTRKTTCATPPQSQLRHRQKPTRSGPSL